MNLNNKNITSFLIIFLSIFLQYCKQGEYNNDNNDKNKPKQYKNKLMETNQYLVKKDASLIKAYARRRNWDIKPTETGLWYMIIDKGNGKKAEENKKAVIEYKIELLDGTLCYDSDSSGPKTFIIGKNEEPRGLDIGIRKLREGGQAVFIIPPHLALGLIGDTKKIPARAIIVYYVTLIKIKEP